MKKQADEKGFTLLEVVIASSIMALIFLSLIEALFLVRRVTQGIRCKLAAEEIAYDTVNDLFNRPTTWFEANVKEPWYHWYSSASGDKTFFSMKNSVFDGLRVRQWVQIIPNGSPIVYWEIESFVYWTDPLTGIEHQELGNSNPVTYAHVRRYNVIRNAWR